MKYLQFLCDPAKPRFPPYFTRLHEGINSQNFKPVKCSNYEIKTKKIQCLEYIKVDR